MKRRVRTLQPGYLVGTKGHSVLRKKTYIAARRPSLDVEDIVVQRMPISRKTVVEYSYPENVYSHASAYSNAVVDDCYDLHHNSKGRDHHLLKKMNNALALLVGDDKLAEPGHPRRYRRRYFPEKPVHRDVQESLAMMGVPDTSGLRASRPPGPSAVPTHSWKAIREVEGYTKPHMSWEYRLDSEAAPEHQIPKSSVPYVHVRDQVRGVQDKLYRHRQLLDRYSDRPAMDGLESHSSGLGHSGGRTQTDDLAGGEILGKVSPLRKKIRKVICKSRHDPSYFDD